MTGPRRFLGGGVSGPGTRPCLPALHGPSCRASGGIGSAGLARRWGLTGWVSGGGRGAGRGRASSARLCRPLRSFGPPLPLPAAGQGASPSRTTLPMEPGAAKRGRDAPRGKPGRGSRCSPPPLSPRLFPPSPRGREEAPLPSQGVRLRRMGLGVPRP